MSLRAKAHVPATAAAHIPGGESCRTTASHWLDDAPAEVYQTLLTKDNKQDSSTLLHLRVALAAPMAAALQAALSASSGMFPPLETKLQDVTETAKAQSPVLATVVHAALRRFDGAEVQVYNPDTDAMEGLRLRPEGVIFSLVGGGRSELLIQLHRKYLPPSTQHGNAPMVFGFLLHPPGVAPELLVTSRFVLGSKQGAGAVKEKEPPKRIRGDAASKPLPAAPTPEDNLLARLFAGGPAAAAAGAGVPVAPTAMPVASPPAAPAHASGRKRGGAARRAAEEGEATAAVTASLESQAKRLRANSMAAEFALAASPSAAGGGGSCVAPELMVPPLPIPFLRGDSTFSGFFRATSTGTDAFFLQPGGLAASPDAASGLTPLMMQNAKSPLDASAKPFTTAIFDAPAPAPMSDAATPRPFVAVAAPAPTVAAVAARPASVTPPGAYSPESSRKILTSLVTLAAFRPRSAGSASSSPCDDTGRPLSVASSRSAAGGGGSPVGCDSDASGISMSPVLLMQ